MLLVSTVEEFARTLKFNKLSYLKIRLHAEFLKFRGLIKPSKL